MTNEMLARSYLVKCQARLKVLDLLLTEEAYSDVVREAQEVVELALKAILRQIGVEPPKVHDVGDLLLEFADQLPPAAQSQVQELARISKWLRKEREFAFYGEVDFIPTEEYSYEDAKKALGGAQLAVAVAKIVIPAAQEGGQDKE
jgi:hypothetical protein